jgi:endonuclease/exonuclease/phosphatase family metal-dependent hydrolase
VTASPPTLTVASYNVRKAIGTDRRRNPQRVLDVLHELDGDVVALQEADKRFGGRGAAVPHELIDDHGLYKPVYLGVKHRRPLEKARKHVDALLRINTRNMGWHGNAILVKRDVGVLDCAALELPTFEPRGAVMAELLVRDEPIRIIGMHLDLSGLWRRRQIRSILDAIARRPQRMPTVLMGDTNEWRDVAGCLKELEPDFHIAPTGPSFHARHPVAALDRIIVHKDLNIEAAGVHMSAAARRASDHLPIWARLSLSRLFGSEAQMTNSIYRLLAWAIENRSPVFCTYDGHSREVCPIILGHTEGEPKALVWQFGGESSEGRLGWKCFRVSAIKDIQLVDGEWKAGSRHQQDQNCVRIVDYDANPASPYDPTGSLGGLSGMPQPKPASASSA